MYDDDPGEKVFDVLGHEDPAALQQLRVRDVAVVGETEVGRVGDK